MNKLKLSIYQNRRYDSDYRTVKKILDEDWLGPVVEAEMRFDRYVPELSYKAHKETPTPAVGCLYDLGSHLVDQALQLFGMPEALFADIMINRPGSQVDDYFDLKLFYPSHRVTLKSSYYVREILPAYIFHGKRGSFLKSKSDVQENDLQQGKKPGGADWGVEPDALRGLLHTEKDGKLIRETVPSLRGHYGDYFTALRKAIRDNAPVPVTGEEGAQVIRVIEAAFTSNREKKTVPL